MDAVGVGSDDDLAEATAAQVRRVVTDLIDGGRWEDGDLGILVVFDAGYDAPRMARLLDGLPVEVLGRMRSDQAIHRPVPIPPGESPARYRHDSRSWTMYSPHSPAAAGPATTARGSKGPSTRARQ